MGVRFTSTRNQRVDVDFRSAVLAGQPPDGGLFIPAEIPRIILDSERIGASISSLARAILPHWIGDDVAASLDMESIFSFPIRQVALTGESELDGMTVVELFHGPTGSFKDFGARFLAACLSSEARRPERPMLVLVATSGDTGSAVADAFASRPGIGVAVLYPKGRVSPVQEAQLTAPRKGVRALAVEGSFDDCQRSVKEILAHGVEGVDVVSANSINVGRLLPQMLFYVNRRSLGEDAQTFVVPCGNLGNLTAGLLARSCVLPDTRFVAATNSNDYFARVLENPASTRDSLKATLSNAMDVADPSNLERIDALYGSLNHSTFLSAYSVDDEHTVAMMDQVFSETGYVADPHTAVALAAATRHRKNSGLSMSNTWSIIATADPAKFKPMVDLVTGADIDGGRFSGTAEPPYAVIRPSEVSESVAWVAKQIT